MPKKQSFWSEFLDLFTKTALVGYFIIANAFMGANFGGWTYDHAWIFAQGILILLMILWGIFAVGLGIEHLKRRLSPPPPPQPKKSPLRHMPFEERRSTLQHGWRKAKKDRLSHARQEHPPPDLPF